MAGNAGEVHRRRRRDLPGRYPEPQRFVIEVLLLFLPPLYLIYSSYRLYMERLHLYSDKLEQDVTHIQELNKLNQAIIASLANLLGWRIYVRESNRDPSFFRRLTIINFAFLAWIAGGGWLVLRS